LILLKLQKYSIGTGDRFGCQGKAQLKAIIKAQEKGVDIAIVWNKSHREHMIIKTAPIDVLNEAKEAVRELGWKGNYYIDADHIGLSNVDLFIDSSNFFTLDVAEFIGKQASEEEIYDFLEKTKKYLGKTIVPNIEEPLTINQEQLKEIAEKYLFSIKEAGKIYRKIEEIKGKNNFVTEISMDETIDPQTPIEILFILAAVAYEGIPIQTIAPKLYGKFNKGVDFEGDLKRFSVEFENIIALIQFAKIKFSLPNNLKLSIHSGSDKFSIYKIMNRMIKKYNAGIHLKTATIKRTINSMSYVNRTQK
jgi:hypothetical protein